MGRVLTFFAGTALALAATAAAIGTRTGPLSLILLDTRSLRLGAMPPGWQVKVNRGTPDISVVEGPSGPAVRLKCRKSSFALERGADIDLEEYPVLTWSWKVSELPQGGDFRRARTDDQAAQVLVAFSDRRILSYIWDSSAPKGTMQTSGLLPLLRVVAVVCRSGSSEANQWLMETRNLARDYEAAFGKRQVRVKGIRLQINSQHTGTSAESYFGEVAFHRSAE